jgi:ATP-dependent Zn protease
MILMNEEGKFIKDTFKRMDLQEIREFLLYGTEENHTKTEPYHERLKKADISVFNRINDLYGNENELTEAKDDLSRALATYQEVYTEIGMKAGARLVYQLLLENNDLS